MDKTYRKLIEDIKVQEEKLADKSMLPIYAEQKVALDKLHSLLGKLYIEHGINGLLKININDTNIKSILKAMGKELGTSEVAKVTSILSTVYKDTYYKNAFTMNSGLKVALKFNILKKENIDAAVNAKYKGELFSDRIWTNKAGMIDELQSKLIEATKGNTTIDIIGKQIKDIFNVTAYQSQRLVQTESARILTQANDDIATNIGVDQQLFSATLESSTCDECQSLDGNIYDVDASDKPEIPIHPLCKCCYINVPYTGWQATQRRDNETGKDISYTNYTDWVKEKGID